MYVEIKHPFAHLAKDDSTVVFFDFDGQDAHNPIASWDDIPMNYPRWSLATHTKDEAIQRVKDMVEDEGWELYETNEKELEFLIE